MAKVNSINKREAKADVAKIIQTLKGKVRRGANPQTRDYYAGIVRDLEASEQIHDQRTK